MERIAGPNRGLIVYRSFQAFLQIRFCLIGRYCKNRKQQHTLLSYSYDQPGISHSYIMIPAETYSNCKSLTVTWPT